MKKRFVKFISLMLVLVMVFGIIPASVIAGPQFTDGTDGFGSWIIDWWKHIVRPLPWYKPTPNYPAQSFGGDDLGGLVVNVEAPAGALPEGTEMYVERVYNTTNIQTAVDNSDLINGDVIAAVDITFYHNGAEFQPGSDVKVTLSYAGFDGCDDLSVVHIGASAEEVVNEVPFVDPVEDVESDGETVSFDARDFSIYAVVGDDTNNTRVTVDFYPNETITDSNRNNRQIVFVSSFTGGNTPVYDPGLPNLGANQAFGGWKLVGSGTAPAGFEYGKTYTVNQINEILIANAESYTSAFTLSFAAVVEDVVFVSYTDQNGVVWKTEAVPLNHSTYGDFTYDSDNFAPEGQNVGLVGWVVMFENGQSTGYVVEDTDDAADFKYKVVEDAPYAAPGSEGEAYHELILYPLVKSGQWIYFNSNIGTTDTTAATYTAPRFIPEGETPNSRKPANPDRDGYTFAEWYTDASLSTLFNWDDDEWYDQLTNNTVYAKWTPDYTTYYVNIWVQSDKDRPDSTVSNNTYDFLYQYKYTNKKSDSSVSISASSYSLSTVLSAINNTDVTKYIGSTVHYTASSNSVLSAAHIAGDGSTTLDVRYDRNTITQYFRTSSGGTISSDYYYYYRVNDGAGDYKLNSEYPSGYYLVGTGPTPSTTPSRYYYYYYYTTRPTVSQVDQYLEQNLAFSSSTSSPYTSNGLSYYYDSSTGYYPVYYYYNNDSSYVADQSEEANYRRFDGKLVGLYGAPVYGWPDANKFGSSSSSYYQWYGIQGSTSNNSSNTNFSMTIPVTCFKYVYDSYDSTASLESWYWYSQVKSLSSYNTTRWYLEDVEGTYSIATTGRFDGTLTFGDNLFYGFKTKSYQFSDAVLDTTVSSSSGTSTSGTTVSYNSSYTYLYIFYSRNKWNISYFDGAAELTSLKQSNVPYEKDISDYGNVKPGTSHEGKYFTGWYKDPSCTELFNWDTTMPNSNVTVYAGWTPEWYRIVFDLTDGGKVDPSTIVIPSDASHPNGQDPTFCVVYGTKLDGACLSKVTTTTGLTFGGWFYDAAHTKPFSFETEIGPNIPTAGDPDGMDMTYATASDSERQDQSNYWKPWSDVGYPDVRGKLVLYPLWRQKVVGSDGIQVRYDAVDGDGLIYVDQDGQVIRYDPFTYTDGALAFTRYSATPNDNGEQFLYWEILDKNGNVVDTVYPGETFPVNLEWAVAEPTRPTYTITWHYRDDNGNWTTVETTVFEGDIPTHSAPAWDDGTNLYEFSSWNTAQDGSGTAPAAAEANADYYAQYTQSALPAKYTVTFKDWDDTILDTQTVYEGYAATAPADPTRTGYTFTGWDADFSNVQSNLTVTAQYSINSYTLTINYVDGSNNVVATAYTGTYNFGAAYSVTSPEVEGYTTETTVVEGTMPARNVTVNVTYTAVSSEKVYELVTSAPSDWSGNYVITYGIDTSMYIMKGVAGTSSGTDIESSSNASAYASSGVTLDGTNKLKNVADDYVFTIAPSGNYYSVKSVSKGSYLGQLNDTYHTLAAYSSLNTTYCRWTPGVGTNASSFSNTSSTSYPYLSFRPGDYNYFWTGSSSNTAYTSVRLWKETTGSASVQPAPSDTRLNEGPLGNDAAAGKSEPIRATTDKYEKVTSFENGGTYLITYENGTTTYVMGNTHYSSTYGQINAISATVPTVGSDGYYTFASDMDVYKQVATVDSNGVRFCNGGDGYLGYYYYSSYYGYNASYMESDSYSWNASSGTNSSVILSITAGNSTRYLRYYADNATFTLTTSTSVTQRNLTIYKLVESTPQPTESGEPTVTPTPEPTVTPEPSETTAPTTQKWTPTDTIVPGEPYLIGFVVDGVVYLATNDGQYYRDSNTNDCGYTARATLDSNNVLSAHVTGLDDINGLYTDLASCTWTFSTTTGGLIQGVDSNLYLATYTNTSYYDLYAKTSSTNGTGWVYDAAEYTLSRKIGTSTVYAQFYFTGTSSAMTRTLMGVSTTDVTTDDVYIQLYSLKDVVEGETYTVTFSYYNENGEYVTVTHNNVAYGAEITPPEVPEREGYTFNGWDSEGYLGVTESHDFIAQYIQDGSMTYTVYLRAVYGEKNTTGTTTIVLDANGLTFASGANATLQGLGWSGFASTNETRTMGNLDINASVRIPAGQIFAENGQAGYTFLGWNTRPDGTGLNFSVSGNGENDFGGATEKTVYVDNLDRSSVNTHVNTLYAMWEGSAMFYHSADNTLENSSGTRIFSTYERQNTGVDITAMVKEGFLYGGYYSDYTGKGNYTYGNIGSGYAAYDGTQVAWTESNAYTAIKGNAFNFQSGSAAKTYIGQTIFIKEVPASTYLRPYLHYTYKLDENQTIMNAWLISDVDDLNYNGTGFIIVDSQYGTTKVVSKLTVTTSGGLVTTQTLTPESVFSAKGAKNRLTYREVIGGASLLNEGDMVYNYWITPDGLRVTGARVCQYYNLGSAKNISVTNNDAIGSLITDPSETH